MGRKRTRLPDYSIGATVLVVAITLPFFVFTRVEHLHRLGAKATPTPHVAVEAVITTPDPTAAAPSPATQAPPTASPTAVPAARAKKPAVHPTNPPATPTSAPTPPPTSTPSPTPTPGPDAPPVAQLVVTAGSVPLTVKADASGSTDTDQTPITEVVFDFGDGTPKVTLQSGMTATHTYATAGPYTVTLLVIDTARLSSTVSTTVTVS
jgi:PKD repeat protein